MIGRCGMAAQFMMICPWAHGPLPSSTVLATQLLRLRFDLVVRDPPSLKENSLVHVPLLRCTRQV